MYEDGQALLYASNGVGSVGTFLVTHAGATLSKGLSINLGLILGDTTTPPTAGVLRIKERTDNNTYPSSTQVDIFARTVGGVQKLYAKFGNGVVRELATA
jgi:hypothetical protein